MISSLLTWEGVEPIVAKNGQEGLQKLYECRPDLIILDIMMPEKDGWQVFQEIRSLTDSVPIIFYTVLDSDSDIVKGLNLGAVDYISKQSNIKVFLARIQAALRYADTMEFYANQPNNFFDGYLMIDLDKRLVMKDDSPIHLTKTEFNILSYLFQHKGFVLTCSQILNHIWEEVNEGSEASLYVYISRLRQKIEKNPNEPQYILTEYGTGYRFNEPEKTFI